MSTLAFDIDDDTPLRLSEAARRCFPDGSMKATGLRRLGSKGLLAIERMNRRDYTTLRAVRKMKELSATTEPLLKSSLIADAKSKLDMLLLSLPSTHSHSRPTFSLYRHFDNAGRLLYVGISLNAFHRLAQHKQHSHWFSRVAHVEIERFPTRMAALLAERAAIRDEKPLHNIAGRVAT
jgi:hypothetical protein